MKFPATIRFAALAQNSLFYVNEDESGKLRIAGGLEAEFVDVLSKSLRFNAEILTPADGEFGKKLANGSWTGLVGMVVRGEADIAMGELAITEARSKVIYYSAPYRYTYLTFATNIPPKLPKFTTFVYPFTLNLWIALLVVLLIMPFIFKILLHEKRSLFDHFFDTMKCFLYEPLAVKANGATRDYFLSGAWLIAAMLISFSYAATLLSFLTIPLNEKGVQDIKELSELVAKGKFRCGTFKGANVFNILRASPYPSIMKLADYILDNHYDLDLDKATIAKFFKSKNSAFITSSMYFQTNFPNSLRLAPEPIKSTAVGMALPKDFCCKQVLDLQVHRMFDTGISNQIIRRVLTRIEIETALKEVNSQETLALSLEDVMGAFIFLIVGIILSIIILIIEIIVSKFQKKKHTKLKKTCH